jgi:hypothetical protein
LLELGSPELPCRLGGRVIGTTADAIASGSHDFGCSDRIRVLFDAARHFPD